MTIHEMAHLMVRVSWRKKSPLPIGRGLFLAPPARLELTTLRLGVDPIQHRQVTPDAKKCLEIQAFSAFSSPSDTML